VDYRDTNELKRNRDPTFFSRMWLVNRNTNMPLVGFELRETNQAHTAQNCCTRYCLESVTVESNSTFFCSAFHVVIFIWRFMRTVAVAHCIVPTLKVFLPMHFTESRISSILSLFTMFSNQKFVWIFSKFIPLRMMHSTDLSFFNYPQSLWPQFWFIIYLFGNLFLYWCCMLLYSFTDFYRNQGLRIFLLTTVSRMALGPTQPPMQWVPGALYLRVNWPGRETDHSPPSSVEVKEWVELYLHSPNTPSWRGA
jgi:hypothetical protein